MGEKFNKNIHSLQSELFFFWHISYTDMLGLFVIIRLKFWHIPFKVLQWQQTRFKIAYEIQFSFLHYEGMYAKWTLL